MPMPLGFTAVQVTEPSVAVVATWVGFADVGNTGFRFDTNGFAAPVVPYPVTTHRLLNASCTCKNGLLGEVFTPMGFLIGESGWGFGPTPPPMFVAPHVA